MIEYEKRYCSEESELAMLKAMGEENWQLCTRHNGAYYFKRQKECKGLVQPDVSGSLRIAAQKLLDAVGKHHPQMAIDTQLDLYMAYHEVREALSNAS